jgi:hypothetical protein|nr:hypothetical protein [Bradyrhizobium sp.]
MPAQLPFAAPPIIAGSLSLTPEQRAILVNADILPCGLASIVHQNASILKQAYAGHSPNSANRKHQITRLAGFTTAMSELEFSVQGQHGTRDNLVASWRGPRLLCAVDCP